MLETNFVRNQQEWLCVDSQSITPENKNAVTSESVKLAFIELAKSVSNAVVVAFIALGAALLGLLVYQPAATLAAILTAPLILIPPLFSLVQAAAGWAATLGTTYLFTKWMGNEYIADTAEHFKYSMHLFNEAYTVCNMKLNKPASEVAVAAAYPAT